MEMRYGLLSTPLGPVLVTGDGDALTGLSFAGTLRAPSPPSGWPRDDAAFADLAGQLDEYLAGRRTAFDVPLRLSGTPFQLAVWAALRDIPFGVTASYTEIAARIGAPTAARAVGAANRRNPISIVVPCHRVLGRGGALTGYAGGLDRKAWLLRLEREARDAPGCPDRRPVAHASAGVGTVRPPLG
jgi:methylated-DNA-[protein]-cysteine S-methyltransferase